LRIGLLPRTRVRVLIGGEHELSSAAPNSELQRLLLAVWAVGEGANAAAAFHQGGFTQNPRTSSV